jgi:hypothetical protein
MPKTSAKYTIEQVKAINPGKLLKLINLGKKHIKKHPVIKRMFEEYGEPISLIDTIPMAFADLDVSAKTLRGNIYLNYRLLTDGDFFKDLGYFVHEISHVLQQTTGNRPTGSSGDKGKNYLDNEEEIEAFQNQIEYLADQFGEVEAEKYVDNLLEHHRVKDGDYKEKKEEELLAKV